MFETDLRDEYQPVDPALPDVIVATEVTGKIHRPAGEDAKPWCEISADHFEFFKTEDAERFGGELCSFCFAGVLRHLADSPDSDVERLEEVHDQPDASAVPVATADGGVRPNNSTPLSSLTERVAVPHGNSSKTYHAPQSSGETICGRFVDHLIERSRAPRSLHPCWDCFDREEIED